VPGTASHVLILDIDIAADPSGGNKVAAHLGHSPSLNGQTCQPLTFNGTTATGCAEGVPTDGTAATCPGGTTCPTAINNFYPAEGPPTVQTIPNPNGGPCYCPAFNVGGINIAAGAPVNNGICFGGG